MKLFRRLRQALVPGPRCDRCGKRTGKPFLYNMPNTWWRCSPCENDVTDILLTLAARGQLTNEHVRYTKPVPPPGL